MTISRTTPAQAATMITQIGTSGGLATSTSGIALVIA